MKMTFLLMFLVLVGCTSISERQLPVADVVSLNSSSSRSAAIAVENMFYRSTGEARSQMEWHNERDHFFEFQILDEIRKSNLFREVSLQKIGSPEYQKTDINSYLLKENERSNFSGGQTDFQVTFVVKRVSLDSSNIYFNILTLGIYPMWSKKRVEIEVSVSKRGNLLKKYSLLDEYRISTGPAFIFFTKKVSSFPEAEEDINRNLVRSLLKNLIIDKVIEL